MAVFTVEVIGVFYGEAGSRWVDAMDQAEAWAGREGLDAVAVSRAGCSVEHSVIPLSFRKQVEASSAEEIEAALRSWASRQPLMLRAINRIS